MAASCGPTPPPANRPAPREQPRELPLWRSTTSRSAARPFFDVAGLSQVDVSTHSDDEFGSSDVTLTEVHRAGKVVCTFPAGGREGHENHSSFTSVDVGVSSREPLRFHVHMATSSSEFGVSETCTGYELPDNGTCRTLFERSCSERTCTLTSTTSLAPGTGKIRGTIVRDGEPFVGATVMIEPQLTITDEHGAFALDAPPGTHEIAVSGDHDYSPKPRVTLAAHQDADVAITIACPCCEP